MGLQALLGPSWSLFFLASLKPLGGFFITEATSQGFCALRTPPSDPLPCQGEGGGGLAEARSSKLVS